MKKKLFIFSNESISVEDNKFYCDNLDLKSTPEGLNKKFEVNLLGRKSIKKRSHEIKLKRIKVFNFKADSLIFDELLVKRTLLFIIKLF